tara:strand:+ start:1344 stop:1631 length:288 start_codon:yes stop_codon:yes gene_type:complete
MLEERIYDIIFTVCDYYGAEMVSVLSKGDRNRKNMDAKRMSIFLIKKEYPDMSQEKISHIFKIDRTTVTYYLKQVNTFLKTDRFTQMSYNYFTNN